MANFIIYIREVFARQSDLLRFFVSRRSFNPNMSCTLLAWPGISICASARCLTSCVLESPRRACGRIETCTRDGDTWKHVLYACVITLSRNWHTIVAWS
jgi:hypothetical protein